MRKSPFVACAFAVIGIAVGDARPRATPAALSASIQSAECDGCHPSSSAPWTTAGACFSINVQGTFSLATGSCTGTNAPCNASPCTWADDVTITIVNNTCSGPLYRRNIVNQICDTETTIIEEGETSDPTFYADGDPVPCNYQKVVRIWAIYGPPDNCVGGVNGGWSYGCSECKLVSGG